MKGNIQLLIISSLLVLAALAQGEDTKLVYFVEYEEEQEEDYIEISLKIRSESASLVEAISSAAKVAEEINTLSGEYCKEYTKKGKGDCKEATEISKYTIEPVYQTIRKEETFSSFVVTHDVAVKVFNPENIGFLVDSFLKYPNLQLEGFQWRPLEEVDNEEAAVAEGYDVGEQICGQLGLALNRIVNIEQIIEQAPAEEEQEEDEEAEEAPEITIYKFQVVCSPKTQKAKK